MTRFLLVVTGHPGSGKTSLAVALASELGVPAGAAGASVVQVVLDVPADVLLARAEERAATGERHPGHLDEELLDELAEQVREPAAPVELPGEVLRVGPDDDPADIARRIRDAVSP